MARDYAKPTQRKKSTGQRAASAQKSNHPLLWLVCGLTVGIFVSGLSYLKLSRPEAPHHTPVRAAKPKPAPKKEVKIAKAAEPKFDFYTLLPDQKSTPTEKETPIRVAQKELPKETPAEPQHEHKRSPSPLTKALSSIKQKILPKRKPEPTPSRIAAKPKGPYYIQIKTFQHFQDADALKAALAFKGIGSKINATYQHGQERYRVYLGPYKNERHAFRAQQRLALNQIQSDLTTSIN